MFQGGIRRLLYGSGQTPARCPRHRPAPTCVHRPKRISPGTL